MPKYGFKRRDYLSREEVIDMIDRAEELWLKSIIAFLYLFGSRLSEALRLGPEDFSLEEKTYLAVRIKISKKRKKAVPIEPHHVLRVAYGKESLKPFLVPLLNYLVQRKKRFPEEEMWSQDRTTVWKRIKKLNPQCSPHFFRHSRLYHLAEKGATAVELKDFAGWQDLRPASHYLAASGELAKKFADKIE